MQLVPHRSTCPSIHNTCARRPHFAALKMAPRQNIPLREILYQLSPYQQDVIRQTFTNAPKTFLRFFKEVCAAVASGRRNHRPDFPLVPLCRRVWALRPLAYYSLALRGKCSAAIFTAPARVDGTGPATCQPEAACIRTGYSLSNSYYASTMDIPEPLTTGIPSTKCTRSASRSATKGAGSAYQLM